jgi:hypothetical protein
MTKLEGPSAMDPLFLYSFLKKLKDFGVLPTNWVPPSHSQLLKCKEGDITLKMMANNIFGIWTVIKKTTLVQKYVSGIVATGQLVFSHLTVSQATLENITSNVQRDGIYTYLFHKMID